MMISDSNGSIIPMVRDATGGFREPVYCALPKIQNFAVGLRPLDSGDNENTSATANDDCTYGFIKRSYPEFVTNSRSLLNEFSEFFYSPLPEFFL